MLNIHFRGQWWMSGWINEIKGHHWVIMAAKKELILPNFSHLVWL